MSGDILNVVTTKRELFKKETGVEPNICLLTRDDLNALRMSLFGGMQLTAKRPAGFTLAGMDVIVTPLADQAPKVGVVI